jgi:hypothetical protein
MLFIRNLLAIIASIFGLLLSAPMIIVGIPLWIVSSLTRIVTYLIQPKCSPWRDLIEFEPIIGWKPMANLDTHYIAIGNDICHILTDSQGWLGKNSLSESDIVVIGDSYAFGYGVNIYDSYINVDPGLKIKAIGSPGYNMVQELIIMQQLSSQLAKKLVVWFICLENDLHDNLIPDKPNFYRTPFVQSINGDVEWEIVTSHVKSIKWPYSSLERPYDPLFAKLCMPGPLSQHVYSACHFLIKEGHDICKKAGSSMAVITIPSKKQLDPLGKKYLASCVGGNVNEINPNYPDQMFDDICSKLGVPFYAGKNFLNLNDYKIHDCHWTKQGNRRVAKFLVGLYGDYMSGKLYSNTECDRVKPSTTVPL